jgi:uncharacterized membrane protein
METKKFTQFGTLSVLLMLPLFLLFTVWALRLGVNNNPAFFIQISLALIFFICLLIFYKLTITVDAENVLSDSVSDWFGNPIKFRKLSHASL